MTSFVSNIEDVAALQSIVNVSRETEQRLVRLVTVLTQWQAKINLVGPSTMGDIWSRHIIDSVQLWPLVPKGSKILTDFGSGGGFPGLVLAALAAETGDVATHLIESDHRKAAFLRRAAYEMDVPVTVHAARAEALEPWASDVITARAFAPLDRLFGWGHRFATPDTVWLLPKGRNAEQELTHAGEYWRFSTQRVTSRTDPSGAVLVITNVGFHKGR